MDGHGGHLKESHRNGHFIAIQLLQRIVANEIEKKLRTVRL